MDGVNKDNSAAKNYNCDDIHLSRELWTYHIVRGRQNTWEALYNHQVRLEEKR